MNDSANRPSNETVFVSLVSNPRGEDGVAIKLAGGEMLIMTPAQARCLATSLITAVNRAEVKASLHVSTNLWRRLDDSEGRLSPMEG